MSIIKLKKNIQDKVWGYEEWLISAHDNGMTYIDYKNKKNISFKKFYEENKDLFGIDDKVFPLLIKKIVAKDKLSVQVHPDDKYAKKHENSLGKTECWFILNDSAKEIIIGQKCKNKEELKKAIEKNDIMNKINRQKVSKDDFFNIPAGTVHAICEDTQILEIQQSSDITYRLYDYSRKTEDGKLRELHIDKSLDVINYDFKLENNIELMDDNNNFKEEKLIDNEYYQIHKITIKNEYTIRTKEQYLIGISKKKGLNVDSQILQKNEAFLILKDKIVEVKGCGELILVTSKKII